MTTGSKYATPIMLLLIAALGIAGMYASMNALDNTPTGLQAWGSYCSQGWWGQQGDMQLSNGDTRFVCWNRQWWVWVKEWSGGKAPKSYAGTGWWFAQPAQEKCQVVGEFYTRPVGASGIAPWGRTSDAVFSTECSQPPGSTKQFPNNDEPNPPSRNYCCYGVGGQWFWCATGHGSFANNDKRILCHNGNYYSPTHTWGGQTYKVGDCVQKGEYYTIGGQAGYWKSGSKTTDPACTTVTPSTSASTNFCDPTKATVDSRIRIATTNSQYTSSQGIDVSQLAGGTYTYHWCRGNKPFFTHGFGINQPTLKPTFFVSFDGSSLPTVDEIAGASIISYGNNLINSKGFFGKGYGPTYGAYLSVGEKSGMIPAAMSIQARIKLDYYPPGNALIFGKKEAYELVVTPQGTLKAIAYLKGYSSTAPWMVESVAGEKVCYNCKPIEARIPLGTWVNVQLDLIPPAGSSKGKIVAKLSDDKLKGYNHYWKEFSELNPSPHPFTIGGAGSRTSLPGNIDEVSISDRSKYPPANALGDQFGTLRDQWMISTSKIPPTESFPGKDDYLRHLYNNEINWNTDGTWGNKEPKHLVVEDPSGIWIRSEQVTELK